MKHVEGNFLYHPVGMLNANPGTALMPDHYSTLKPGYIVAIRQNVQPVNDDMNEARYFVKDVSNKVPLPWLVFERGNRIREIPPCIPYNPSDEDFPLLGFFRTPFPVCNCFVVIACRVQKQSLVKAVELTYAADQSHINRSV